MREIVCEYKMAFLAEEREPNFPNSYTSSQSEELPEVSPGGLMSSCSSWKKLKRKNGDWRLRKKLKGDKVKNCTGTISEQNIHCESHASSFTHTCIDMLGSSVIRGDRQHSRKYSLLFTSLGRRVVH